MHNSTQQFWTNKHVIVTGGVGFLGSSIVRKLHERGAHAAVEGLVDLMEEGGLAHVQRFAPEVILRESVASCGRTVSVPSESAGATY
jgi:NAD(P)-dependent dehydrogenase (short-subunit alcohol dehydrogenase family)